MMSWFLIQSKGSVQGSDCRGGSGGSPTSYMILCAGDMFTTLVFCFFPPDSLLLLQDLQKWLFSPSFWSLCIFCPEFVPIMLPW